MKKMINFQLVLSIILCFIPFIITAVFYEQLPEQMAIHFNSSGDPDNYAPKLFVALGLPFIMLCLHLYTLFMLENDPKKLNSSKTLKLISKWIIPLLSMLMQVALISYAIGHKFNWNFYILLLTGVIIVIFGNYLPKCKQNYTIGIKIPWTLNDQDNWNKTHRMAGYLWILGGFLLIVNAFVSIVWMVFVIIILLVLVPILYSYFLYRKFL